MHGAIDYLNKETDTPELFIELGPPLDNAKPALLGYIDRRIDALEEETVDSIDQLQEELEKLYRTVEKGEIPTSVPRIEDPEIPGLQICPRHPGRPGTCRGQEHPGVRGGA